MTEQRTIEDVAMVYASYFSARQDAHSPWIATPEGGQWIARREPLTAQVVIDAFRSGRPVGGYVAGVPDAEGHYTTHLACLDVDLDDGFAVAIRIAKAMKRTGIPAYLEGSRRGAHLWCLLDRALPGPVVRRALLSLIGAAGVEPDPKIELRPAQDHLSGADGLGYALRMPLMPHQRTGVRGELMDPAGRLVATRMHEAVMNLDWADAAIVEEWAERWVDPKPALPVRDPSERPDKSIERFNDAVGVCEVLTVDWGADRAIPGRAIRCVAHDDHNPSLSILRDDRRVLCHQPSCLLNNGGRGRDAWDLAQLAPGRRRGAA